MHPPSNLPIPPFFYPPIIHLSIIHPSFLPSTSPSFLLSFLRPFHRHIHSSFFPPSIPSFLCSFLSSLLLHHAFIHSPLPSFSSFLSFPSFHPLILPSFYPFSLYSVYASSHLSSFPPSRPSLHLSILSSSPSTRLCLAQRGIRPRPVI